MAKFVYFKNACKMYYPIGQYFSSDNFDYIREAASSINKVFPTGKLILVVRGHSGSILAGSIAYILKRKGREVLISVSRKAESTHGENLEGISSNVSDDTHIIVVDDFVQTGETIEAILKDLTERIKNMKVFDMLCVANGWDKGDFTEGGGEEREELTDIGRQTKELLLILSIYCVTGQMRNESISSITIPILLSMGIHQI